MSDVFEVSYVFHRHDVGRLQMVVVWSMEMSLTEIKLDPILFPGI
jgi:hypothetical protein